MATWGEMTPEEQRAFLEEVRRARTRDADRARRALRGRRLRAWRLARRVARMLRERYGARRVVLIGSLARGNFTLWSDIDLVAFGIPPERFFAAHGEARAAGLAAGIPVELHCGDAEGFPAEALIGGRDL